MSKALSQVHQRPPLRRRGEPQVGGLGECRNSRAVDVCLQGVERARPYPLQLLRGVSGLSLAPLNLARADDTGAYSSTTTCAA